MKKKTVIIPFFAIFIIILLVIFYREGILFNNGENDQYSDSLRHEQDSTNNVVPLGNPPSDENIMDSINGEQGSNETGTNPDGVVSPKDKKMIKDTSNKVVPLGKPPVDEDKSSKGNEGSSDGSTQEDKSK